MTRRAPRRTLLVMLIIVGLVSCRVCTAASDDFSVTRAEARLVDGAYALDADIDYAFSDRALEALQNGVPLTVEVHVQVREADGWIWDASLADQRLRYRIRYKPLSGRYLVSQLPGENGQTYVTRDAAIAALGEIRGLYLVSAQRLDPEKHYEAHLRSSLDIEELPLPLRPMAYLRPDWKQSTGWTKWPLTD